MLSLDSYFVLCLVYQHHHHFLRHYRYDALLISHSLPPLPNRFELPFTISPSFLPPNGKDNNNKKINSYAIPDSSGEKEIMNKPRHPHSTLGRK